MGITGHVTSFGNLTQNEGKKLKAGSRTVKDMIWLNKRWSICAPICLSYFVFQLQVDMVCVANCQEKL